MTRAKLEHLRQIISDLKSVLVAFSGGTDSSLLLKTALEVLGTDRVLAVTSCSGIVPAEEGEYAEKVARFLGARHIKILTEELKNARFLENPPNRCYYCKKELFSRLRLIAENNKLVSVIDGSNADDAGDFRPGLKANQEFGVRSPLREAGLTKAEIRTLAKKQGLPNWSKPSLPCLSSRFPYGSPITPDKLRQVEQAERFLRSLDLGELRVRHYGETARIEVRETLIKKVASPLVRKQVTTGLKSLGFNYVTLDLTGFRSGSMNEVLPKEILNG